MYIHVCMCIYTCTRVEYMVCVLAWCQVEDAVQSLVSHLMSSSSSTSSSSVPVKRLSAPVAAAGSLVSPAAQRLHCHSTAAPLLTTGVTARLQGRDTAGPGHLMHVVHHTSTASGPPTETPVSAMQPVIFNLPPLGSPGISAGGLLIVGNPRPDTAAVPVVPTSWSQLMPPPRQLPPSSADTGNFLPGSPGAVEQPSAEHSMKEELAVEAAGHDDAGR